MNILQIVGILFFGIGVVGVIYCLIKNRRDVICAIEKEVRNNRVG